MIEIILVTILVILFVILFVILIALLIDAFEWLYIEFMYNNKQITFNDYYERWLNWYKYTMLGKLIEFIEEIHYRLK